MAIPTVELQSIRGGRGSGGSGGGSGLFRAVAFLGPGSWGEGGNAEREGGRKKETEGVGWKLAECRQPRRLQQLAAAKPPAALVGLLGVQATPLLSRASPHSAPSLSPAPRPPTSMRMASLLWARLRTSPSLSPSPANCTATHTHTSLHNTTRAHTLPSLLVSQLHSAFGIRYSAVTRIVTCLLINPPFFR